MNPSCNKKYHKNDNRQQNQIGSVVIYFFAEIMHIQNQKQDKKSIIASIPPAKAKSNLLVVSRRFKSSKT